MTPSTSKKLAETRTPETRSGSSAGRKRGVSARAAPPPRLLAVLVPVCTAGALTLAYAAFSFAAQDHSAGTLLGLPGPDWMPSWLGWCAPVAALWAWALALVTWRAGVRHYQGGGG